MGPGGPGTGPATGTGLGPGLIGRSSSDGMQPSGGGSGGGGGGGIGAKAGGGWLTVKGISGRGGIGGRVSVEVEISMRGAMPLSVKSHDKSITIKITVISCLNSDF